MKTIGVGVIGWGFMGKTHTHALRAIPMFYDRLDFAPRLAAVCSRNGDKARAARDAFGFDFATDDYHELLARPDVEAVSVCTPNGLHERMALDVLAAGKHLYIDKPLSVDAASARRIADAGRAAGVAAQVVMNNRFFPSTMRAKRLMDEGRVGEITSFSFRYLHSGSVDEKRPMGWKQGLEGGVLLDLGSHALDLLVWLMGRPDSVLLAERTLYGSRPTREGGLSSDLAEDHALALLRMPGGALGTLEASKISTGANDELTFEICGKKGALRWSLMEPDWLWFYDNSRPDGALGGEKGFTRIECGGRFEAPGGSFLPSKNTVGWDRGHIHCYYSFLEKVAHGGVCSPSLDEGAYICHLMDKMKESAARGWTSAR